MFLGIDVSKKSLDVALIGDHPKPLHKVCTNDAAGHARLLAWLEQQSASTVHACLEATGTWAQEVALALHEAGHLVSVYHQHLHKYRMASRCLFPFHPFESGRGRL